MKFLSNPVLLLSLLFFFSQAAIAFDIARLVQYAAPLAQQGVQYGTVVVQAAGTPAGIAVLSLGVSAIPLYQIGTNRGWYHFFQSSNPNFTEFSPPVEQLTFDEPSKKDFDVSEWLAPTRTVTTTTQTVGQFPTATTSVIHYTVVYSDNEQPVMEVTSEVIDVSTDTQTPPDQCPNIPLAYFTHRMICPAVFPVKDKKPYRPNNSAVLLPAAQPHDDAPYLLAAVRFMLDNGPDSATFISWVDVLYDLMIEFPPRQAALFAESAVLVVLLACVRALVVVKLATFTILLLCDMILNCGYMCIQTWHTRRDMAFERNTERLERREDFEIRALMTKLRPQVYAEQQRDQLVQQGNLQREEKARAAKIAQDEKYEPLEHNNVLARVQRSKRIVILEEDEKDYRSTRAIDRVFRGRKQAKALALGNGQAPYLQIENGPDSPTGDQGGKGKGRAIEDPPGGKSSGSNTAGKVVGPDPSDDLEKKDAFGFKSFLGKEDEGSDDKGNADDDDNSNPPPPGAGLVRPRLPLIPDLDDGNNTASSSSSFRQSNVSTRKRRAGTRTVSVGDPQVCRRWKRVDDLEKEAYREKLKVKKSKTQDFTTSSCSEGESGDEEAAGIAQELTANDDETQPPPKSSTNEESQGPSEAETLNAAPINAEDSNREVSTPTREEPQLSVESELEIEQNGAISPKIEDGNRDAAATQATVKEALPDNEAETFTEEEKEPLTQTGLAELTEAPREGSSIAGAYEKDDKLVENTADEANPSATIETEQSPAAPTGDEAYDSDDLFDPSTIDEEKLAADLTENDEAQNHSPHGSQHDPSDEQPKKTQNEGERQSTPSSPEDSETQTAALTEIKEAQTHSAQRSQDEPSPPVVTESDKSCAAPTEDKNDEDDWESDSPSSADDGNLTAAFVQNNEAQAQESPVNGTQDETSTEQPEQAHIASKQDTQQTASSTTAEETTLLPSNSDEAFSSNESAGGIVPSVENHGTEIAAPIPPQVVPANARTSMNSRSQHVREPSNAWGPYGRNTRRGGRSERQSTSLSSRVQAGNRGNRAGDATNTGRSSLFQQIVSEMDAGGSNAHQTSLSIPPTGVGYDFDFNSMVQQQAPTPAAALMLGRYTVESPSQQIATANAPLTLGRYLVEPPPQVQPEAIPLPYTPGDDKIDFPASQPEATVSAPFTCETAQAVINPAEVPLPFAPGDDEIDFPVSQQKAREPAQTTSDIPQVVINPEIEEEPASAAPTLENNTLGAPEQQQQDVFSMGVLTDAPSQVHLQPVQEDQAAPQAQYAQEQAEQEAQTMRLTAQHISQQAVPLLFFNRPQEPQEPESCTQDAVGLSVPPDNDMDWTLHGASAPIDQPVRILPEPSGGHHAPQQAPRIRAEAHSRIRHDPAQDDVLVDEDNMDDMFGTAYGTEASAFNPRFGYQPTLTTSSRFPSSATVEASVPTAPEQAMAFPGFGPPHQGIETGALYDDANNEQGSPEPMLIDGYGDGDGDWQDPDVDMDSFGVDTTQDADTVPAMLQFDNQYFGDIGDFQEEEQQPLEDFQEDYAWNQQNYGPVTLTGEEVRNLYQQGGLQINSAPVPQDQILHSAWDRVATVAYQNTPAPSSQDRFSNAFRQSADPNISLGGRLGNDPVNDDWLNEDVYADADQFQAPDAASEWLNNNIPLDEDEGGEANEAGWTGQDTDFEDGERREPDEADEALRDVLHRYQDSPRSSTSSEYGSNLGRQSPPNESYADIDIQSSPPAYDSQSESEGETYVPSEVADSEAQLST